MLNAGSITINEKRAIISAKRKPFGYSPGHPLAYMLRTCPITDSHIKTNTMKKFLLILSLIPMISFGQITNNEKVITVVGVADKDVEPDWIQLNMSAKETEDTNKESDVVKMENSVFSFITSLGLEPSCFSIDRYSANTKYSYSKASKFKLSKSYKLRIENKNLLDTIIAKCFDSGMDNINVNQIGHSKIDSLQNIVLQEALISAKNKANLIAKTMGVNLGKVVSVNETYHVTNNRPGSYQFNDYQLDEVVVTGYGTANRTRVGSSLSLSKIQLNKTVIAKYEIQ